MGVEEGSIAAHDNARYHVRSLRPLRVPMDRAISGNSQWWPQLPEQFCDREAIRQIALNLNGDYAALGRPGRPGITLTFSSWRCARCNPSITRISGPFAEPCGATKSAIRTRAIILRSSACSTSTACNIGSILPSSHVGSARKPCSVFLLSVSATRRSSVVGRHARSLWGIASQSPVDMHDPTRYLLRQRLAGECKSGRRGEVADGSYLGRAAGARVR